MKGKRLVAMVVAVVVALGSVCWKPPKAQAVFTEPAVALGCALLTSVIVGTTASLVFTDAVKENIGYAIDGLVTEYLDTVGDVAATTSDNFFSIIASGPKLLTTGAILLSKEAGELIARFVAWLQTEKGLEAGGESISLYSNSGYQVDDFLFTPVNRYSWRQSTYVFSTNVVYSTPSHTFEIRMIGDSDTKNGFFLDGIYKSGFYGLLDSNYYVLCYDKDDVAFFHLLSSNDLSQAEPVFSNACSMLVSDLFGDVVESSLNLYPKSELQTISQEIPDSQAMVISGIDGITLDNQSIAADAIFNAVLAGTLAPTVTVEDVATDIPDTGTETDTSILSWVKKIWQSVADIPAAIAEAVASIFVPSADFYPTAIASLKDAFSDRMGLLTYPISILFDFLDRMVNLSEQQPILRWGNIYLPGYATPLVAAGQYNLNDAIGTSTGKQLHDIYLVIVDAIMILAFVDLCRRKYQKIIDN